MNPTTPTTEPTEPSVTSGPPITRFVAQTVYGLLIAGTLIPPLLAVGLLLNLWRRGRVRGTWLATHFSRQTRDLALSAAVLMLVFLPIALGGGFLLASMIGSGQVSSDGADLLAGLPVLVYLGLSVVFVVRMAIGWRALRRGAGV